MLPNNIVSTHFHGVRGGGSAEHLKVDFSVNIH